MSDIDKQTLRKAAEKYRTTYVAHLKNPRNYDVLDAWDKATSEFMALVNNDELNIIASLIDEIDMETGYREGAFVACNRWHTKFRETEAKLEAAEKRIAELEARAFNPAILDVIAERQRQQSVEGWTPSMTTSTTTANWLWLPFATSTKQERLTATEVSRGDGRGMHHGGNLIPVVATW